MAESSYAIQIIKSVLLLEDVKDIQHAHSAYSSIILSATYMATEKYAELTQKDVSELRSALHDLGVQALGGE